MAKCPAFMDRYRTQVSVGKYFYNPLLTTLLSTLLIRLSKKKFIDETTDSKHKVWKTNLTRLITPSVFLVFTVLLLSIFRSLNLGTEDFIKPAFNLSVAWIIYRLVGIFTSNRAWLRTIAILLFGLAALQSFGVLSVTIELLEMISFQFGERKISILDLINGIGILLALLWGTSFLEVR